jgi:hypothetical protein
MKKPTGSFSTEVEFKNYLRPIALEFHTSPEDCVKKNVARFFIFLTAYVSGGSSFRLEKTIASPGGKKR